MESDSTLVTGSPAGLKAPRAGHVIAERFEIRDLVEQDALVLTYRAVDQETDAHVLVRVTAPGVLGEREAKRVLDRLRPLIGARGAPEGASVWPGLLDADRDGALVSTVEPWPKGTSFRAVLAARKAKGTRFAPAELLPFISRLAAALDGLSDRGALAALHHADLRASRIFVHPDGMSMTGGFLLGALPGDAVSEVLGRDVLLRRTLPPEFADGLAGRPADRHAVAALAWEALEGSPPPPSARPADCRSEPALGAILLRYLDADPAARPATLKGLVEALAARADAPLPEHHDRLLLRGGSADEAPESSAITTETGSYQLTDGELLPMGETTNRGTDPRARDLDPDLVAAAKAAAAISKTGTFQLDGEELIPVPARKRATPMAQPTPSATSSAAPKPSRAAAATETTPQPPAAQAKAAQAKTADTKPVHAKTAHAKATQPKSPKAKAKAQRARAEGEAAAVTPATKPRQAWEHTALPRSAAPPSVTEPPVQDATPSAELPSGRPTLVDPPAPQPTPTTGSSGMVLIVGAVVMAVLILGSAFWYRAREEQLRHEREIEQRLHDLRQ